MHAFRVLLMAAAAVALAAGAALDAGGVEEATEGNFTEGPEALRMTASPEGQRLLQRHRDGSFPPECASGRGVSCFPKCCPPGQFLRSGGCQPVNYVPFDPLIIQVDNATNATVQKNLTDWQLESYYLVIGNPCSKWMTENYTLIDVLASGDLYWYYDYVTSNYEHVPSLKYCLEYSENDTEAFICYQEDQEKIQAGLTSWLYTFGFLVSISGLVLTMVVYLSVDCLRDLHGKSLICHVGCLAVAYVLLTAVQLSGASNFGPEGCRSMAFAIQFFLLSSFLWLHVMCLDSFWCVLEATGCSPAPYPRAKKWVFDEQRNRWFIPLEDEIDEMKQEERKLKTKKIERRVFLGYSVYVWTLSLLPVIVVLVHNLSPTIPSTYVDFNMKLHCVIYDAKSEESLLYFYPFTSIFILVNIIIFICILIKAIPFKWNPTGSHRVPRQKARMVFLLFVLMSSNWVIDLISWAVGGRTIVWVMLHAFYILQGLITFLIFVLEDRVKDRIKHNLWPQIRRLNRNYGCCHRSHIDEEDVSTALRANHSPNNSHQAGWVMNGN